MSGDPIDVVRRLAQAEIEDAEACGALARELVESIRHRDTRSRWVHRLPGGGTTYSESKAIRAWIAAGTTRGRGP